MDAEQAFCIALLHDMGTVALYLTLENEFNHLMLSAKTSDLPFDELEQNLLGFDHAELGAALAESWNLPKVYSKTIKYHHRPSEQEEPSLLTDILHVADTMVRSRGISGGLDGTYYLKDEGAFERVGFDQDALEAFLDEALEKLNESGQDSFSRAA